MDLILLLTVLLILVLYILMKKPDNFPPGPTRWPLIGNILMFKTSNLKPLLVIQNLKKVYGNVVGFYIGSSPSVVISGFEELKEAMAKPEFQGRPVDPIRILENWRVGVLMNDGPNWRENRRFTLRRFREMGMGKNEMEEKIHEEVKYLIMDAKRMSGEDWSKPVPVHDLINPSGINIILQLLAGFRFDRHDPGMKEILNIMRKLTNITNATGGLASNFPMLLKYAPWITEYPVTKVIREEIRSYMGSLIDERKKKDTEFDPFDLIEFYLREIGSSELLTEKELRGLLEDLFLAGSDTTTGALAFSLLYMVLQPETQKKVQEELDNVVDRNSVPSMADKIRLPYTEATVTEALRISNVVPLSVPHSVITTEKSTTFRGYDIPKRTRIIMNIYDVHMDKDIWGDPENFRPERFIDDNGKFIRDERVIAFGSGKRVCVGESLARMNLFLTVATILHKFTLSLPANEPRPSTEPQGGFTHTTAPFNILMTPR